MSNANEVIAELQGEGDAFSNSVCKSIGRGVLLPGVIKIAQHYQVMSGANEATAEL
jgi:hypothetical protein